MIKAEINPDNGNFHDGHLCYQDFFRKGGVGDSTKHLTLEMIRRLDEVTKEKFKGTGLAM